MGNNLKNKILFVAMLTPFAVLNVFAAIETRDGIGEDELDVSEQLKLGELSNVVIFNSNDANQKPMKQMDAAMAKHVDDGHAEASSDHGEQEMSHASNNEHGEGADVAAMAKNVDKEHEQASSGHNENEMSYSSSNEHGDGVDVAAMAKNAADKGHEQASSGHNEHGEGAGVAGIKESHVADGAHEHKSADQAIVQNELEEVGIKEKVGTILNPHLKFVDHNGKHVNFGDFFDDKPVVLSFLYYTCPSICQYVMDAQKEAMSKMGMELGEDFRAVSISFDKNDTTEDGLAMQRKYSSAFNEDPAKADWTFLTGTPSSIQQATSQLGFQFKWVEESKEFAHTAAIYVITPQRKVSRYFYGLNFSPFDLKLALAEAKEEKMRSSVERVLLYCYRYDESERGYVADAWRIMRVGAGFTAFGIIFFLILMFRMERSRRIAYTTSEAGKK